MADLIAQAEGLDAFRPSFEFLLLDEGRIPRQELEALDSPVAAMFEIEQSRDPRDFEQVVEKIGRVLAGKEMAEVRQDFATWLKRLIVPARFAEFETAGLKQLEEFQVMIEQRVKEWEKQLEAEGYQRGIGEGIQTGRREGIQTGRREGIQAGRREGLARGLKAQLELKFGPPAAAWSDRLESASFGQLETWSCKILSAETLDQIFDDRE